MRLRLAPAAVLSEHAAVALAYVQPTLEGVRSAGVRIAGAESLAALIAEAKPTAEVQGEIKQVAAEGAQEVQGIPSPVRLRVRMQLPPGLVTPPTKWPGAIYKPGKGGAKPPWEHSYDRFCQGESLESIALSPAAGRPIQTPTVRSHILTAWTHGKPVDLNRLFQDTALPLETEWLQMEEAAATVKANFAAEVKLKEILAAVLGDSVNRDAALKSDADKELERQWYERLRVWEAFRKVGFSPTFSEEPDAKRQRL